MGKIIKQIDDPTIYIAVCFYSLLSVISVMHKMNFFTTLVISTYYSSDLSNILFHSAGTVSRELSLNSSNHDFGNPK